MSLGFLNKMESVLDIPIDTHTDSYIVCRDSTTLTTIQNKYNNTIEVSDALDLEKERNRKNKSQVKATY
jgi:hypothetical protein